MTSPASPPLVLASASPRRAELLERVGYRFTVRAADVDESVLADEPAAAYAARVAGAKADAIWEPGLAVVAADTCVVVDDLILGKPVDAVDALRMLRSLVGRSHTVLTAVRVVGPDGDVADLVATALVTFGPAAPERLAGYVAGGEPMDKAGAYALQGQGAALVESVDGDPTTVIGLPLRATVEALTRVGLAPPAFGA
ncbi:Maf family protein [Dermatobacter hominis]|uniref:Maf family protein n=1 Tax=Dermatobacter hominis TaxID=2884263 RepID=UPI001D12ACB4|nr:Maf family protein [Dermatobacter hominis]UDY35398.1 Maf family protein [Dermatobacter hominis]